MQSVLQRFVETGQDKVLARIRSLNLRMVPPILPVPRGGWLGDSPAWM